MVDAIQNNLPVDGIIGIVTRRNIGTIQKSPLIENLDSLPYPDWKQINPAGYKKAPHGGLVKTFPVAPIISTRGSPFECTFCSSPFLWDRTIRFRSPENIVGEIEYLIDEFKVREIHFEDDNLTLKREHIEGVCNIILKRNIKINWATPNGVRADTLDWNLLRLMKESGCYSLAFGIESGNQEILNRAKKKTNLETIEKTVRLAKKLGIITQGFFIFGLPGETEKTIQETIDFAKRLPLDKAQFLILDILPGSQLWDGLRRDRVVNWNYKSYQEATWVPEGLDGPRLRRSVGYAFRSFFFRPRQILFLLKYFKVAQTPFIIKRIIDYNMFSFFKD
ncbi:MAG: radical SAM protein [Candidatus Omnitrophica bacterium]|nr:radical SAM protein [Candidatus Omnitrophota bacterium]